jgi:hypothetical protein
MIQYKRIGELLMERGVLTQQQLDHVIKTKLGTTLRFGEIITELGYATEDQVTEALADQYGYETVDLSTVTPDPEALKLIPSSTAVSNLVLPLAVTKHRLTCAIADPLDIPMTDSLTLLVQRPVELLLAAPSALFDAVTRAYGISPIGKRSLPFVEKKTTATSFAPPPPSAAVSPVAQKPGRVRRKPRVDLQEDKFVLLAALSAEVPA